VAPCQEADVLIRSADPENVDKGLAMLRTYADSRPDDAVAWYRLGSALDFTDREAEAMVAYQRVFDLGVGRLDPDDQPCLYVQAGSTLRNLDRLDEARSLLEAGRSRFPKFAALTVFLALIEVSAGRDRRAIDLLFEALLDEGSGDGSIEVYSRALHFYAGKLRQP